MLGSADEAEDAIQETWLRLADSRAAEISNLGGWLTTVAARICLDMLRSRSARKEEPLDPARATSAREPAARADPEQEAITADAVGLALLVVLDRLTPAERIAFVLHDLFAIPFAEIGPVVGRTPATAKKLASRARAKVRGRDVTAADRARQWRIAEAFLTALRDGDVPALLDVLDPEVTRRADRLAAPAGVPAVLTGAEAVARGSLSHSRTAARYARLTLINGSPGLVVAQAGQTRLVVLFSFSDGKITDISVIAEPAGLAALDIATAPRR